MLDEWREVPARGDLTRPGARIFLSLFCNTNRLPSLCCGDAGGSCISLCSSLQAHMWRRQYPVFPQQHCTAPWRRGHHRRITMSQLLRCDIPAAGGGRLYRHHRQRAKPTDSRTAGNPGVAAQVASAQILRRFQPAFHEEGNDSRCQCQSVGRGVQSDNYGRRAEGQRRNRTLN